MFKYLVKVCTAGLAMLVLANCGGASDPASAELCRTIDQRTYYSTDLRELGRGPIGANLGYWTVRFDKGDIQSLQSDFGLTGTYACIDGAVLAEISIGTETSLHVITFSDDLSSLKYHPFKETDLTYHYVSNPGQAAASCETAANNSYASTADGLQIDFLAPPRADISIGRTTFEGYYNCQLDQMRIHRSAEDTEPYVAVLEENGELLLTEGERTYALAPAGGPMDPPIDPPICTKEYEPVCAATERIAPCLTLPCPTLVYQTFGNRCEAGDLTGRGEPFEGECGKREGMPVTELNGVACLAIFDPVCAKTESNVLCVTEPCPSHAYRTAGNACSAGANLDPILFNGECGALQDTLTDGDPIAFVREGLPETAKTVEVLSSKIEGDKLSVELGYSGCQTQHFDLVVDSVFVLESNPVQHMWAFVPQVEDLCEAYFTSKHTYDLTSLRPLENSRGTVILNRLIEYAF